MAIRKIDNFELSRHNLAKKMEHYGVWGIQNRLVQHIP